MATDYVKRIQQCKWYAISKGSLPGVVDEDEVRQVFGGSVELRDGGDEWLISAESRAYEPATLSEIGAVEELYKASLPEDYRELLLQSNGADIFIHPQSHFPSVCECSILSTQDILSLYSRFLRNLSFLELYPSHLYYIPVADLTNGSYASLSTFPDYPNEIFWLYADSGYLPYTPQTRRSHYHKIFAPTFSEWLDRVLKTCGAFGLEHSDK